MTQVTSAPLLRSAEAWLICPGCRSMVYRRRLERSSYVCPDCDHHYRLSATQRLDQLLDAGSAVPLDAPAVAVDPLSFVDSKPYPARLAAARGRTGLDEAVVCVTGRIGGHPAVVAAMDFDFLGGSLGSQVGERITRAAEFSGAHRIPLVIVAASGGARMQEGAISLMQMAMTCRALRDLDEAGVLTVSIITDPTYGGVAASFATACDVVIAEPAARLGFAGPRVIEQTIRQPLPAGFQTAEFLLEHGLIDAIRPRAALRSTLARLLGLAAAPTTAADPPPAAALVRNPADLPHRPAWEIVTAARALTRPTALDLIALVVDDFAELRGDRLSGDCPAIVGGVGRLAGRPVVVIGHQKGHTPHELIERNFGMPQPAGYRKAARLMRLAEKLGWPVVTLIDTPGAYPGAAAEEHGQAMAIADNLRLMAGLRVPIVSVVIGEGGSGGALALAVADRVLMRPDAVYSVISPEGCAAILWGDATRSALAADALGLDARTLLRLGVVDAVVPDPPDPADSVAVADRIRAAIADQLDELLALSAGALSRGRRARFRKFGAPAPIHAAPEEEVAR